MKVILFTALITLTYSFSASSKVLKQCWGSSEVLSGSYMDCVNKNLTIIRQETHNQFISTCGIFGGMFGLFPDFDNRDQQLRKCVNKNFYHLAIEINRPLPRCSGFEFVRCVNRNFSRVDRYLRGLPF